MMVLILVMYFIALVVGINRPVFIALPYPQLIYFFLVGAIDPRYIVFAIGMITLVHPLIEVLRHVFPIPLGMCIYLPAAAVIVGMGVPVVVVRLVGGMPLAIALLPGRLTIVGMVVLPGLLNGLGRVSVVFIIPVLVLCEQNSTAGYECHGENDHFHINQFNAHTYAINKPCRRQNRPKASRLVTTLTVQPRSTTCMVHASRCGAERNRCNGTYMLNVRSFMHFHMMMLVALAQSQKAQQAQQAGQSPFAWAFFSSGVPLFGGGVGVKGLG